MMEHGDTEDLDESLVRTKSQARPGLILLFSGQPQQRLFPVERGGVEIGRERTLPGFIDDPLLSRRHFRVTYAGRRWTVTDLDSRNGTFLDGVQVKGTVEATDPHVLRAGQNVFLFCPEVDAFRQPLVIDKGLVLGVAMQTLLRLVAQAATTGTTLHIHGESGSGKEVVARAFHDYARPAGAPFVAVNCATIPEGIADRILFGAVRGAFSGATEDSKGLLQAAHKGTLFLDEIAELDAQVQAKLLRALETPEARAVGATSSDKVDILVCSATNKELRALVTAKQFREDLMYRVGRPVVRLPPLRERPEEIPTLVANALDGLAVHASLIEACLLRRWNGNVRELMMMVRDAGRQARARGEAMVKGEHLEVGTLLRVPGKKP